jgi:hypothetical protein
MTPKRDLLALMTRSGMPKKEPCIAHHGQGSRSIPSNLNAVTSNLDTVTAQSVAETYTLNPTPYTEI